MKKRIFLIFMALLITIVTMIYFLNRPHEPDVQVHNTKDPRDAYVTNNAYQKKSGSKTAFELAQRINDDAISINAVKQPIPKAYRSVGRFINHSKHSSGTAVAIDKHTLLTNNHVVESTKTHQGKRNYRPAHPRLLRFIPMQSPTQTPYTYTIKSVHMIKGVDLAVVHTKEDLSHVLTPMPIASEKSIEAMSYKDRIKIVGYPQPKYFASRFPKLANTPEHQMFVTQGYYLNEATTVEPQFYFNAVTRKGNSGSPIMNDHNELIGIFPNAFNNSGNSSFEYNAEEMGYGVAITKHVRQEILKNME
ncbi:trypsin-like serine peptidase [Staphylococcus americanisciuri]|uniref:Serine protease n=1 Tax=Staphylococcus americanisciuri TaxID=2973940 RepID=A0ABT2F184_9STAP|nr:trypsin-like peptidase domain-containing protein [Staphylococcus americanisciuri]MCS4486218.1 trypsin-like peptidase domain-containing protein [Staphylococcus americanisciuri]